jgi:hypothetical protein
VIEPVAREPRIDAELCPRCGMPYQPGQEYCLDCGVRLPSVRLTAPLRRAWERRLPYPGDWVWPVIVGLLVAGLAGAVVIAVSNDGGRRTTLVATEPPVKGVRTTATTAPPESSTAQSTTPRAQPKPPPPRSANRLVAWPRGQAGWTIVLESVPKAGDGRSVAVRTAKAALHGGVPQVGVLDSNRFASLHPDYYVVFSGVYSSNADATRRVGRAQSGGYPKAYVRQITP